MTFDDQVVVDVVVAVAANVGNGADVGERGDCERDVGLLLPVLFVPPVRKNASMLLEMKSPNERS